mmetsp:Transcript_25458/g.42913  ORF Transcript_25458/g.42913 Transcript_25458/m.42913 type:complete len:500 (+) Transcript_25458:103-1602(+)
MTTIINGRFTLGRVLGSGMQAEVRKGIDNNSNKAVALKIIDKTKLRRRTLEALEREVEIMKVIRHRNVLRLKAVAMDTTIENKTVAVLVLEIAEGGELFEFLMHTKHFEETLARTYFHQLISALHCCHKQNIYHRDIKPENILMSSNYELKLADFGLGNSADDESDLLETECGTRSYMAPEILMHNGYRGDAADVWSAGVVLFIMLLGSPPFDVATRTDWWFNACSLARYDRFWAAHLRGAPHMETCLEAQDLLNRIFVPNPKRRITIEEMMTHPWMQGPTLDDAALKEVMHERSMRIQAIKAREHAMVQRQGGHKRGLGSECGDKKGSVDVFKKNTHRSVGKPLPQYEASAFHPMYGDASTAPYQFYAHNSGDVLQRITAQLLQLDAAAKVQAIPDEYRVEAAVTLPGDSFELDGEVIETPGAAVQLQVHVLQASADDEDTLVVAFSLKTGAVTAFQACFSAVRDQFEAELKLAEMKLSDDKEQVQEEKELSEDLGMI